MGPSKDYSKVKKVDNASDIEDDMSDKVYTIDSIHHGLKAPFGICDDYVTTLRDIVDVGDTDWIMSFVFRRKIAHQSKYMFNVSENNAGLLLLLKDGTDMRRWRWRCLTNAQV
ncbi:hypothetical protein GIB67_002149 [Kingdonia uniflora]|uniref:Uncharacterized protein n=1 Tax=Kingdonia uniflora TaxID=39325 RepID=A0A7J7KWP6_9MAGN|nr:hypothetical protein GIB67_002149 [Kingdonia uniflora]